jgi:hypothetical protein
LYSEARRLVGVARVATWHHSRMAGRVANAAMDLRASVQTAHPRSWTHTADIGTPVVLRTRMA